MSPEIKDINESENRLKKLENDLAAVMDEMARIKWRMRAGLTAIIVLLFLALRR